MTADTPKSSKKRKMIKASLCMKMPLIFRMTARAALLRASVAMFSRNQDRKWMAGCRPITRMYCEKKKPVVITAVDTWVKADEVTSERNISGKWTTEFACAALEKSLPSTANSQRPDRLAIHCVHGEKTEATHVVTGKNHGRTGGKRCLIL